VSKSGAILRQPNEGKKLCIFGGVEFLVKASSQESGGAFTLLDSLTPAGTFLPPHVHAREDETFYILEGEFDFYVADQTLRAGPGATVHAPRGLPHAFKVVSTVPGRALVLTTPGGFERCMEELSALPNDPADMPGAFQVCARCGIEFLPPTGP
jgi:mannose-6-phosphate isomerase-like protein (cupin superfamily)